jgi:cytochrome c6
MEIRFTSAIKLSFVVAVLFLGISVIALSPRTAMTTGLSAAGESQRSGAAVYSQTCARCHGADGRGKTAKGRAVGASDLTSSEWVPDTARDTRIVTRGKEAMPAFKGKLKPAEIDAVVAYIRRFKN